MHTYCIDCIKKILQQIIFFSLVFTRIYNNELMTYELIRNTSKKIFYERIIIYKQYFNV